MTESIDMRQFYDMADDYYWLMTELIDMRKFYVMPDD